jgi:hypothetical protein
LGLGKRCKWLICKPLYRPFAAENPRVGGLREPAALLDAWSQQVGTERPLSMRRFYVPGLRAEDLTDKLAQALEARSVDYAITHEVAAQRYAPFLSSVSQARFRLIPGPGVDAALADLNAPQSPKARISP